MGTLTTKKLGGKPKPKAIMHNGKNLYEEPYCYDGPTPSGITTSITTLLSDLLTEQGMTYSDQEIKVLIKPLVVFTEEFFTGLESRKDGDQCEIYGENCKTRLKDLVQFLNIYLSDTSQIPGIESLLFTKASGGDSITIPISEIRYLPKRFQGFFLYNLETGDIMEHISLKMGPGFYSNLYRYIIRLTDFYQRNGITSFDNSILQQTFLLAVSVGSLFEKTNVTKDVKKKYINDTISMLTGVERVMSLEVKDLFESVVYDLDLNNERRQHPVYVSEMRTAYRKVRNRLISEFEVEDLYVSTKATASSINGRSYFSAAASLFETDPLYLMDGIKEYDEMINFNSLQYYRTEPLENYRGLGTKTVWINNPNKRKPRAIHIGMNAVQDRCKWIHNRAQLFLRNIPSDCMEQHFKGVEFLMRYTQPGYRIVHQNSLLNFDFSNATDTLSTEFQYLVVQLFHGTAVANMWKKISTLPKVAILENGDEFPYSQTVGQPQGLLGSFDLFSEAHHMILLMVMKATGRENLLASEFYHLVGDDSAINTVTPDPEDQVKDWYYKICTEANLIVNMSKSNIYSGDPTEDIILDFAKTTVRNGRVFSALPVGLALSYTDKDMLGGIAANIWFSTKGMPMPGAMERSISRNFRNYTSRLMAMIAVKSGDIPYLSSFKDDDFMSLIDEDLKKGVLMSFLVNMARSTIFEFCLSEKDRESCKTSDISLQYAWDNIFPPRYEEIFLSWIETAPVENKFSFLIEDAFMIQKSLRAVYDNLDELQSEFVAIAFHDKDLSILNEIRMWMTDMEYQSVEEELKPGFWYSFDVNNYFKQLNSLSNMHIPSFAARTKQQSRLFKGLIPTFVKFFGKSEYMSDLIDRVSPELIEKWTYIDDLENRLSKLAR